MPGSSEDMSTTRSQARHFGATASPAGLDPRRSTGATDKLPGRHPATTPVRTNGGWL
jgi:hypothetical protein